MVSLSNHPSNPAQALRQAQGERDITLWIPAFARMTVAQRSPSRERGLVSKPAPTSGSSQQRTRQQPQGGQVHGAAAGRGVAASPSPPGLLLGRRKLARWAGNRRCPGRRVRGLPSGRGVHLLPEFVGRREGLQSQGLPPLRVQAVLVEPVGPPQRLVRGHAGTEGAHQLRQLLLPVARRQVLHHGLSVAVADGDVLGVAAQRL